MPSLRKTSGNKKPLRGVRGEALKAQRGVG